MFDRTPSALRELLWQAKHGLVSWLHRKGLAESFEAALSAQLKELSIDHVLDVGANRGQFVRQLRRLRFTGRVFSFEPLRSCYEYLESLASNDPNWEVYGFALGDVRRSADIHVAELDVLSSLLPPTEQSLKLLAGESSVATTETISVFRLDEVLPGILSRDKWNRTHLKLDTQGFDLNVLRGLGEALSEFTSIQTELSVIPLYQDQPDFLTALAYLRDSGFELTALSPVQRVSGGRILELDALLLRVRQ